MVALESLRLPLAFRLPRARLLGFVCGVAMLAGLSVITGEAASLAFENLIFQRARPVAEAERDLAKAEIDRGALKEATDRRVAEIAQLQSDVEAAQKHPLASTGRPSCNRRRRGERAQGGAAHGIAARRSRPKPSGRTPPPKKRTPTNSGTPAR